MSLARLAEAMMKTHELAFANRPDMAPFCSQGNAFKNVRLMDATYLSKQQSLSTLGRLGGILTIIGMKQGDLDMTENFGSTAVRKNHLYLITGINEVVLMCAKMMDCKINKVLYDN